LKFANGATLFSQYHEWHQRLRRSIELDGFDRPRFDWRHTPEFFLFAKLTEHSASDVQLTLSSLRSQIYSRWRLYAVIDKDTQADAHAAFSEAAANDRRLMKLSSHSKFGAEPVSIKPEDFLAAISFGDQLQDFSLGILAEIAARHPDIEVIYSDEDSISDKKLHSPILKPDWSPLLNQATDYIGNLTCVRHRLQVARGLPEAAVVDRLNYLEDISPQSVIHVPRLLYRRTRPSPGAKAVRRNSKVQTSQPPEWSGVAIVLPTKDRPDLLETCLAGLKTKTEYPDLEVIIVDNGTTDQTALSILSEVQSDPRFSIIRETGPFNYSKLCNAGVHSTKQPFLVFLNNDIVVNERNWLKALMKVCQQPQAGVVGAKLLFPNGRLQHAGVTLGIGGLCGHSYFNAPSDETGDLAELTGVREVSAVTAACCAVSRKKFLAVGGFDEINLPVELNDIDLCLRIASQGWQNYWTSESTMIHLESASRGVARRHSETFAKERAYFIDRWLHIVRDDPYFHPALSLFAHRPALG